MSTEEALGALIAAAAMAGAEWLRRRLRDRREQEK